MKARTALAIPALAGAVVLSALPALAGESVAPTAAPVTQGVNDPGTVYVTPSEMLDLQAEALKRSEPELSTVDAKALLLRSSDLSKITKKLQEQAPASFSRTVPDAGVASTATIWFKGATPDAVAAIIKDTSVSVKIRNDAKWTEKDALAIVEAASSDMYATSEVGDATGNFDHDTGEVTIKFNVKKDKSVSKLLDDSAKSKKRVKDKLDATLEFPVTVKHVFDETFAHQPAVLTGGTALSRTVGGGLVCSAAFGAYGTASSTLGRQGLLTADHCSTPLVYESNLSLTVNAAVQSLVTTDVEFVSRSGETSRREFIFDLTSGGSPMITPAVATGTANVTDPVCNFGWRTKDMYCSRVESTNGSVNYPNRTYYGISRTVDKISDVGDSGGPWFVNNTALGVTSGHSVEEWSSMFSTVYDGERRTGTKVKIS